MIKVQLICTCGNKVCDLQRDESIESQIENKLQLCEICISNRYDDPYMCDDCSLKCDYCGDWFCPEHVDEDHEICSNCKEDRLLCEICDNYKEDCCLHEDQTICDDCLTDLNNEKVGTDEKENKRYRCIIDDFIGNEDDMFDHVQENHEGQMWNNISKEVTE